MAICRAKCLETVAIRETTWARRLHSLGILPSLLPLLRGVTSFPPSSQPVGRPVAAYCVGHGPTYLLNLSFMLRCSSLAIVAGSSRGIISTINSEE
jgi:hypothetical protein